MADVFNKEPVEFVDLNELFPVLNSAVGLTYEQFRILVENTFWLKNQEEIGVVKAFIVSGSSQFGSLWLSETDGGAPLIPNAKYIYIVQTNGNFKNKIFSWNGSIYEQLAKDSDNNYTNADKQKVDKIKTDGDGDKYLNDKGDYEEIQATGIPEAPNDGKQYVRKNEDWVKSSIIEDFDGTSYFEAGGNVNNHIVGAGLQESLFKQNPFAFELSRTRNYTFGSGTSNLATIKFRTYGSGTEYNDRLDIEVSSTASSGTTENYIFDGIPTSTNENKVARLKDIPKIVFAENVVVAVEDWVADTTYTDYDYKAVLTLTGMLSTYEPSVVFGLAEVESGNFASVCLAGTDTITIYAKEIPSASITIPLIKGEQL